MKRFKNMKTLPKPGSAVLAAALALLAGPATASEFWLCAKQTTLALPDGTSVPMWGYAQSDADFADDCAGDVKIPGPTLEVTDGSLTIHLRNDLPEPTSVFIPGQALPAGSSPTFVAGRVRSFGTEVAPSSTGDYVWSSIDGNGTLIYHSGTHPQKQVYMGLSGLVTNDAAPGQLYPDAPAVPYDNAVELFFSDIDPAFNAAVAAGTLTTAIDRRPTWFLINGAPYVGGASGTPDITAGNQNGKTLLRLASTATDTHVAVIQGLNMTIHAEDGQRYNWQNGDTLGGYAPRVQYSAMLPPAKTKDAMIVAAQGGRYAVYDGNGYMTNPSDPAIEASGDTVGGMLRFLSFTENQPPVAVADAYTTDEDTPLVVDAASGVLANDSDPGSDPLTAVLVTGPSSGNLTLNADGSFTYTPNPDYNGADSFTYVANDGTLDSDPATVTITIDPVNDAPVPAADAYTTDEDTPLSVNAGIGVLANDTDVDGDTLTVVGNTATANGTLAMNSDGSFTYTPDANFNGTDTFTYDVSDGTVTVTNTASVITVAAVNDPPVAADDSETTDEDTAVTVPVMANDTDADGDALTVTGTSTPANGSVVITADNSVTYTPGANYVGTDSFTYDISDGNGGTATATVTITVNGVNDAPVADAQGLTTPEDTALAITLTGSDPDGDALTYSVVGGPADGTLSGTAPSLTYTPNANFNGTDSFTFVVNDGLVDSVAATVSITVTPVNDLPVANDDSASTAFETAVTIDVLANDTDADGDTLSISAFDATSANGGAVSCTATCAYTPAAGFSGIDSFTYVANDGAANSNVATVTVTVGAAPNTPPLANADSATTAFETPVTIDVLANDTDADGDTLSIGGFDATSANGGTVSCTATCDYTPATGFSGVDTFTYTVSDGNGGTDVGTVTVAVDAGPQPTVALYFSTAQGVAVPAVASPYNNADIYASDGSVYSRALPFIATMGFNANVDAMDVVDADTFYLSFSNASVNIPGFDTVQDEDVVLYDAGTWSLYFDGTLCGLNASNGQDIDAISIDNGTLYFSTAGGGNGNPVSGVAAPYDDADVYTWTGGASCGRALDASAVGLPGNAAVDGLTVKGGTYYLSFSRDAGTAVPTLGTVQDESVVSFDGTTWAMYFAGTGLNTSNGQDLDAVSVP